jgi:L-fuconolactonase
MSGHVDAHQHFWFYEPESYAWIEPDSGIDRDFTPSQLAAELATCGIAKSIAVAARQNDVETRWLLDLAAANDFIGGVVGWIDLTAPDLKARLAALAGNSKLVGFRHHVQDEPDPDFLWREDFQSGVRQVLEAGYAYDLLIHAQQLGRVPRFLDAVGPGRIVLDHGAKPAIAAGEWEPWATWIARIAGNYPVSCKISGLITQADRRNWSEAQILPYMEHLMHCFGPERLLYGSDWPVCLAAATYREVHALILRFLEPLTDGEREAIMGGNARRIYAPLVALPDGQAPHTSLLRGN